MDYKKKYLKYKTKYLNAKKIYKRSNKSFTGGKILTCEDINKDDTADKIISILTLSNLELYDAKTCKLTKTESVTNGVKEKLSSILNNIDNEKPPTYFFKLYSLLQYNHVLEEGVDFKKIINKILTDVAFINDSTYELFFDKQEKTPDILNSLGQTHLNSLKKLMSMTVLGLNQNKPPLKGGGLSFSIRNTMREVEDREPNYERYTKNFSDLLKIFKNLKIKNSHMSDELNNWIINNVINNIDKQDKLQDFINELINYLYTKDELDEKSHVYLLKILLKCIANFDNDIAKNIIRTHILDKDILKDFDLQNKIIFIFLVFSIGDLSKIKDIQQFIKTTKGQDKHLIVQIQEKVNNSVPVNLSDLLDGIIKTYQLHT